MPYKSREQAAYMHIHHPDIAAKWDAEYHGKKKRSRVKKFIDPDKRLRAQKKISAGTSIVGGTLGLAGLGMLTRKGPTWAARSAKTTTVGAGVGGLGAYNYASIQNQEAKKRPVYAARKRTTSGLQPVKKGLDMMDFGLDSVHQGNAELVMKESVSKLSSAEHAKKAKTRERQTSAAATAGGLGVLGAYSADVAGTLGYASGKNPPRQYQSTLLRERGKEAIGGYRSARAGGYSPDQKPIPRRKMVKPMAQFAGKSIKANKHAAAFGAGVTAAGAGYGAAIGLSRSGQKHKAAAVAARRKERKELAKALEPRRKRAIQRGAAHGALVGFPLAGPVGSAAGAVPGAAYGAARKTGKRDDKAWDKDFFKFRKEPVGKAISVKNPFHKVPSRSTIKGQTVPPKKSNLKRNLLYATGGTAAGAGIGGAAYQFSKADDGKRRARNAAIGAGVGAGGLHAASTAGMGGLTYGLGRTGVVGGGTESRKSSAWRSVGVMGHPKTHKVMLGNKKYLGALAVPAAIGATAGAMKKSKKEDVGKAYNPEAKRQRRLENTSTAMAVGAGAAGGGAGVMGHRAVQSFRGAKASYDKGVAGEISRVQTRRAAEGFHRANPKKTTDNMKHYKYVSSHKGGARGFINAKHGLVRGGKQTAAAGALGLGAVGLAAGSNRVRRYKGNKGSSYKPLSRITAS